jgi:hypothetical protein
MIAVGWSVFSKLEVYRKLKGYGDLSLSRSGPRNGISRLQENKIKALDLARVLLPLQWQRYGRALRTHDAGADQDPNPRDDWSRCCTGPCMIADMPNQTAGTLSWLIWPVALNGLSREADRLTLGHGAREGRGDLRVAVGQRTSKGACLAVAFASSQRKYLNLNSQCELLRMWPQCRRGQGA